MKIVTAYDAWWFLYEHPRLNTFETSEISEEEFLKGEKSRSFRQVKRTLRDYSDRREKHVKYLRIWKITRHALGENLDIFYAMVNDKGRVDDDKTKNTNPEVWLELGQLTFEVTCGEFGKMNYHDPDLDCGAATFDEALIKLARKVRRKYGTYHDRESKIQKSNKSKKTHKREPEKGPHNG